MYRIKLCIKELSCAMNRFYIPEHCSTEFRILGMSLQLRCINAGTISKEVELRDIHLFSRFITLVSNCINFYGI